MPVTEYRFGPRLWKTTLPDNVISKLYKKANTLRDAGGLTKEELSKGNKEWVANPTLRFDAFEFTWMEGLLKPFIDDEFAIDQAWVNYFSRGMLCPLHNHERTIHGLQMEKPHHLSFGIYLDVPEELLTEQIQFHVHHPGAPPGSIEFVYMNERKHICPKTGDVILFDSNLLHKVIPFRTPNIERVMIAGNIYFI